MRRCYNFFLPAKRDCRMLRCRAGTHRVLLLATIVAAVAAPRALAQNWTQPAHELAGKIAAHAQSRAGVALTVRNISSLDAGDVADARRAIESQLRASGVKLVAADQGAEAVEITFSENAASYVWVAQIGRPEAHEVAIVSVPRPPRAPTTAALAAIRRVPLIAEPLPILDAAQLTQGGASVLLVLDAQAVKRYVADGDGWKLDSAQPLAIAMQPRDPRGRLVVQDKSFAAFLPGTLCTGTWTPSLSMTCGASDDPWPLALTAGPAVRAFFNSSRNFFTGPTTPSIAAEQAPFYSAARLTAPDNSTTWLIAATDGNVRIVGVTGRAAGTVTGWGSSMAALTATCGAYVLASRASSLDEPDTIRAFQLSGRKTIEASAPLDFPGPVTELWTQPGGNSVLAIAKNLKTGAYEASSLSFACGR